MEKNVLSRRYEMVVIIDARLTASVKDALLKEVVDTITKSNGKIINNQVWLEKQKMTFSINKCNEGTYYLINFEADGAGVNATRHLLRLNEKLLRFSILEAQPSSLENKPVLVKA